MYPKQVQKLYTYFSLKIVINDEISEVWTCKKKACIEMKWSFQSRDNHGYCGTIMMGGGM